VADCEPDRALNRSGAEPPRLIVTGDPVRAASAELARAIEQVLSQHETASLAVPGGSALAALPCARKRLGDAWSRVLLTWLDERCVPLADTESNRGAAQRLGALAAENRDADPAEPMPALQLPLYLDGESPDQAVARVEEQLRVDFHGRLDVLLLGMGDDGHIASLFPSREPPRGGLVAHVPDSPKPPADRITLTPAALATARHAVLLVMGEPKRAALLRLLAGDPELPAQGLAGRVVVTDLDVTVDP
jgi:6-phosphogluconolactonase